MGIGVKTRTYIYGLKDPRDGLFYYVGKSDNPKRRLFEHVEMKGNNQVKNSWIAILVQDGMVPDLVILEKVTLFDWQEKERYWIEKYRSSNHPLANISAGGGGGIGVYNPNWDDGMDYYLSPCEYELFKRLNKLAKIEFTSVVVLKMMPFTKAQLSVEGRIDDYIAGYEAQIGADFASKLIKAVGTDEYYNLVSSVVSQC
jgi:hypothetical protein